MDKRRALFLTKIGFELFKLMMKFCFILLGYSMTTAEEFILIHKNQFMKEQPYTSKFLNDPSVQHTGAQLSFLDRMRPNEYTNKRTDILYTRETTDPTELQKNCEQNSSKFQHDSATKIYQDGENS